MKKRILLVSLFVISIFILFVASQSWDRTPEAKDGVFSLSQPPFIIEAQAASSQIGDYLDEEAGISAWTYTTDSINLTNAATAYRIIEDQTSEYIIGSVDIPNYEEHYDVHVYIHIDGYILAYYLRPDAISKILNIKEQSLTSTKLESAIGIVAGATGVSTSGISYYDFRYPNAENMLLVYENSSDGNDFTIEIPGTFSYYDRGFAGRCYSSCNLVLDEVSLQNTYIYKYGDYEYGTISAASLTPDVTHTFTVGGSEWIVLLVVYTEP